MDATMVKPSKRKITGKRSDTETVMLRLEGGGWKSTSNGNSLATYPTSSPVLRGGVKLDNDSQPKDFRYQACGDTNTLPDYGAEIKATAIATRWLPTLRHVRI